MDFEDFKIAVSNLARSKSDFIFNNSNPDHASVVIAKMLEVAESEFIIYDDDLSGDLANRNEELYDNLAQFVRKKGKLRVVVDNVSDSSNRIYKFISDLHGQYPENVSLRKSSEEFRKGINALTKEIYPNESEINFACGDRVSFRVETVKNQRKALCSFNRPSIANHFWQRFDLNYSSCRPLL